MIVGTHFIAQPSNLYLKTRYRGDWYSPRGQSFMLQTSLSLASPLQFLPPYWGWGLLHTRARLLTPPPHVAEQVAHGDQGPQLPSTEKMHLQYLFDKKMYLLPQTFPLFVIEVWNVKRSHTVRSLEHNTRSENILSWFESTFPERQTRGRSRAHVECCLGEIRRHKIVLFIPHGCCCNSDAAFQCYT